jgi:hypothetical protein
LILRALNGSSPSTPHHTFVSNTDFINGLYVDANSNVIVTGYQQVSTIKTCMTARLNPDGTLAWKRLYDGGSAARDDIGNAVMVAPDGAIYVAGVSDRGLPNNNDIMVIKSTYGSGKIIWVNYFDNGTNNDAGYYINAIGTDYVYIGGTSGNESFVLKRFIMNPGAPPPGGFGSPIVPTPDHVIYQPVPANNYTSITGISVSNMIMTSNSTFYVSGSVTATEPGGQSFSASYLTKFWAVPGSKLVFEFDLPVLGDFTNSYTGNNVAVHPSSQRVAFIRDKMITYSSHNLEEVNIEVYNASAPFRLNETNESAMTAFPNPASDVITISSKTGISGLTLLDLSGKTIFEYNQNSSGEVILPVQSISRGVYILRMKDLNDSVLWRQLILQ